MSLFFLNALTLTYKTFQLHFHLIPRYGYKVNVDLKMHLKMQYAPDLSIFRLSNRTHNRSIFTVNQTLSTFTYIHYEVLNENAIETSYM